MDDVERRLERAITDLLARRRAGATICPSDAARAVWTEAGDGTGAGAGDGGRTADRDGDGWRELMEPARRAAARLVAAGEVEVTQGGEVVDLATARGPVRIRRVR
jgi:hypothetical protein